MNLSEVQIVRIYLVESDHSVTEIIHYLRHEANIKGFSVFRAISGYGESGELEASLLDLSLNLPLVIEFFDNEDKIASVLTKLNSLVKPKHVLTWKAQLI